MYENQPHPQENVQLPDDIEFNQASEDDRLARLKSFAGKLKQKRIEAQDGRRQSGIEDKWSEDDDHYNGVDNANRKEMMLKSPSVAGSPYYLKPVTDDQVRSTVFVNITAPYVDMASSRVADLLLPTDDRPFSIKPTPIPEISASIDDQDLMPDGKATVGQAAKAFIKDVDDKADKAETQIWDWLVESNWHTEARKVIEQAARLGAGVMKGPFPELVKKRKVTRKDGVIAIEIIEEIKPKSKWIDVKNLYPDPTCGNNIHNGSYIFEKEEISSRQLRELKDLPGYIKNEIDELLKEGPGRKYVDTKGELKDQDKYEIWYYYGGASAEDLQAAGMNAKEGEELSVIVAMINDRVIKASLSVFDTGSFPFDVMVWQRSTDHWVGQGVSRQIRTAQRIVNAATRSMLDNAGVAAGPQIIIRRGAVRPADGEWSVTPMKIWTVDEDADVTDVAHAIQAITIPTMQAELENIIKYGFELAEKSTNMPLLIQGNQGNSTETVGGMTILDRNASSVLKRIAKICDDDLIEPHIQRYYEWLLIYGEDDSCKGDFSIISLGSSSFLQRDAENQAIMALLQFAGNQAFHLDPDKLMIEVLKMNKISPDLVRYTDEQITQMTQAAQQNPPKDPKIEGMMEVEKLRQQGGMQKEQLKLQIDQSEMQIKSKNEQDQIALKIHLAELEMQHAKEMKQMELNLEMMKLSQEQNISLDTIKSQLAQTTMKLKTQKELSMQDDLTAASHQGREHAHELNKQIMTPPTEPIGRAETGHAFEQ